MTRSLDSSSIKPKVSIILASGSESRKVMLEEACIVFDVIISSTDEDLIKNKISFFLSNIKSLEILNPN